MKKNSLLYVSLLAAMPLVACGGGSPAAPLTEDQMAAKLVADFAAAIDAQSNVKSARFDHGIEYPDTPYEAVGDTVDYGTNNAIHFTSTDWGTVTDHYAYRDSNDNVYAYNVDADGRVLPDTVLDNEQADNIDFSMMGLFNPNPTEGAYSLEALAKVSADHALENSQKNRAIEMPTATSYNLSFNTSYTTEWEEVYYYSIEMSAEFDAATKALTKLSSKAVAYMSWDVEVDEEGIFEPVTDPLYYNVFNYEATLGAREAIDLPYDVSEFYFTSFGLSYNGETVVPGSTVEVNYQYGSYESVIFALDNVLPATANHRFDNINVVVIDKATGAESYALSAYFGNDGLALNPQASGEFTVTLSSRDWSFTFDIDCTVSLPNPESLTVWEVIYYYDEVNDFGYYYTDFPQEKYAVGSTVSFSATADPYGADDSCTMTLTCDGSPVSIIEDSYDAGYMGAQTCFTATLDLAGVYELTVTSTVDPTVSTIVTFTVA